MMNGLQFMAHLLGKLEPDEQKVKEAVAEFTKDYPHGAMEITKDRLGVKVSVKPEGDKVLCMKCGNPMVSRVNQYFKDGLWVNKARRDMLSNWECPTCAPGVGGQPLMVLTNTAKDVSEQDIKNLSQSLKKEATNAKSS